MLDTGLSDAAKDVRAHGFHLTPPIPLRGSQPAFQRLQWLTIRVFSIIPLTPLHRVIDLSCCPHGKPHEDACGFRSPVSPNEGDEVVYHETADRLCGV